ncbi:hypothetical protein OG905_24205 [Streptomyces sp. NBC_00322]|nr:hypothetical protein [Streptomyces sp. NBC_00322]
MGDRPGGDTHQVGVLGRAAGLDARARGGRRGEVGTGLMPGENTLGIGKV